jgi:A/G-specific adenine glycosylase
LAEIFLQQTNANRVAKFIGGFISRFPGWSSLAEAEQEEIESAIFPLGIFKRRARTIHALANTVTRLDKMPHTRQGLEQLPGIGQYIANVLLVMLYRKRLPFLDVNMARVLERFFGPRELADIRYDPYLQALSRRIINTRDSLSANWMILDFAAIVCTKRRPRCSECPLLERCQHAQ